MDRKTLLIAVSASIVLLTGAPAVAERTIAQAGALVCVTDKWTEKEVEKGHKIADAVMRCVAVPDSETEPKYAQDCTGHYEYAADGSWKSEGSCTNTYKDGDKSYETWEEGSHLKQYLYKRTGGTGKYEGVTGGGTYMYEGLTDALFGGRYKGTLHIP